MRTLIRKWALLFLFASMASVAMADEGADCMLFTADDMQGAAKALKAADFGGSAPSLDAPFSDRIGSIWVRDGYALESYDQVHFKGVLTTWSPQNREASYHSHDGGSYINTRDAAAAPKVASYRCRVLGNDSIHPQLASYMTMHIFRDARLAWVSGGNHPNHKWVELTAQDGVRTLLVHEDNTYGINRSDYVLDVDQGTIQVTFNRSAGVCQDETLTRPTHDASITGRLSYIGALQTMLAAVRTIAEGNDLGYVVLPPKPELREIEDFLGELLRQAQG